jgi:hypothetical protein
LPSDWEELSKEGPGSDAQATFSREFCAKLAEHGEAFVSTQRTAAKGRVFHRQIPSWAVLGRSFPRG